MRNVQALGQDHAIAITWSENLRGVTPTEYWVQVGDRLESTEDTQITVSGLRNGQSYEVVVYAATARGRSEGSEPVSIKPTNGAEGEVAGLIVEFSPGVSVNPGQEAVPGEVMTSVDMVASANVTDDTMLVEFKEPVTKGEANVIALTMEADPRVEWAEPDQFLFTSGTTESDPAVAVPDDPNYASNQWNLWDEFGVGVGDGESTMTEAWNRTRGKGATVAVIDTGITSHLDLDSQLVQGFDFVSSPDQLAAVRQANAPPVAFDGDYVSDSFGGVGRDANPTDPGDWRGVAPVRDSSWHGTQMAGIISAQANNSEGIVGIAPGAKIEPIRALSWRGGLLSDIASSITWASGGEVDGTPANENPSDVINMSFSVESPCPVTLQTAIDDARDRGAVLVAAAGNANDDAAKYAPGNCNGVITVGATARDGLRAQYSNYGERIDVSAPGGAINADGGVLATSNDGTTIAGEPAYRATEGTSVAAAHVSAAAALYAARNQQLKPEEIAMAITGKSTVRPFASTTCDTDPAKSCGDGILDLAQISSVSSGDQDLAMSFNGTSQYGYVSGSQPALQITGSITIEVWVKLTRACTGDATVVRKYYDYGIWCGGTTWFYTLGTNGSTPITQSTNIPIAIGEWQHVALTRAAGQDVVKFYVNGQLAYTGTTGGAGTGLIRTSNDDLELGSYLKQYSFIPGQMDEVRLYSTERTAAQVLADMHTYGPVDTTGLAAYYDFNEGLTGTTGTGVAYNRASGASTATNARMVGGPTYADTSQVTSTGSNTVVRFPRSYLNAAGGWRAPEGIDSVTHLVVGGGASGTRGVAGVYYGSGGGGGGVGSGSTSVSGGTVVGVTVGQGGIGLPAPPSGTPGFAGQSSLLSVAGGSVVTSTGGQPGTINTANGGASGSGVQSGTTVSYSGGVGSSGLGAGGGGGAGGAGSGLNGGIGFSSSITGIPVLYGSGGAGLNSSGFGSAYAGGGRGTSGTANTGGGGSDLGPAPFTGGGSGVVIVSYPTPAQVSTDDLALVLNGSSQSAASPDNAAFDLETAFTAEFWVKPSTACSSRGAVVRKSGSYVFLCSGGTWRYGLATSSNYTETDTAIPVRSGEWQHLAFTRASGSSTVLVYADGQLAYTGVTGVVGTGSIYNSTSELEVGKETSTAYFTGTIDELRLFTAQRTAAQVLADMATYGPTTTTGLTTYYDFNEGTAGIASTGTVYNRDDGAASATNLTTAGSPTYADVKSAATSGSNTVVTFPRSYLTSFGGWRTPTDLATASYLVVGGGGGGGGPASRTNWKGGGGAGGQLKSGTLSLTGSAIPVTVGMGGKGAPTGSYTNAGEGQSSKVSSVTSAGGGRGGSAVSSTTVSGSYYTETTYSPSGTVTGGGGSAQTAAQRGATGTSFSGGNGFGSGTGSLQTGGGGAGAGGAGGAAASGQAGNGGAGVSSSITGTATSYGGGGGGAGASGATGGTGGAGGGGAGGKDSAGTAGTYSRGGGGGGGTAPYAGGRGGSGVVIVSYVTASAGSTCTPNQTQYTSGSTTYRVVAFVDTGSCSWKVPTGVSSVDYLVVGGGGGGASRAGGGAGAGGLRQGTGRSVTAGQPISVAVGRGGAGASSVAQAAGAAGEASSLSGAGMVSTTISVVGGGAGGVSSGGSGGSGGGTLYGTTGAGTSGEGSSGGTSTGTAGVCTGSTNGFCAAGGGGSSAAGGNAGISSAAGVGGAGSASTFLTPTVASLLGVGVISGSSVMFAGGGGGGVDVGGTAGTGGSGGGGTGGAGTAAASNGISATGGGGGGGGYQATSGNYVDSNGPGGSGGSGVIVLRYALPSTTTCAPQQYVSGVYTVLEFQGTGACTWTVPSGVGRVDALAVGGGGGGGSWVGGGGGGGGVASVSGASITPGASITVTVGAGGTGSVNTNSTTRTNATSGGSSSLGNVVTALGGGNGGSYNGQAAGGSGTANGGGAGYGTGGVGSAYTGGAAGQNASHYWAGGGAGAGANGGDGADLVGGNGGAGTSSTITGATVYYGGGGGGSIHDTGGVAGIGGLGGGGYGKAPDAVSNPTGLDGTDGLGGGGGGSGSANNLPSTGGSGGDGVVILRYTTNWLSMAQEPGDYTYGTGWVTAPTVQIVNSSGSAVAASGVSVTATFTATSGSATLGSATVTTDSTGLADFSAMTLIGNAATTGTLSFSATGYGAATSAAVTVLKAPLTVTAADQSVSYGTTVATVTGAGSVTYSGFKNSETSSVVTGTPSYTTTYTATTDTGTADLTITPDVSGLTATNYSFSAVDGAIAVTQAPVTVTAAAQSVEYGSTAASVTSAGSVTYSGFRNSQTSSVVTGTPTYTTTYTATTDAATSGVTITPVVSGLSATNYSFTAATGAITVTKAVLTVTAAAQSVEYGTAATTVTGAGSVTYSGFKNSQSSSVVTGTPTYITSYTGTTDAATASVTIIPVVSGLTATNYSFVAATGAITVTKAPLTVTAAAQSVEYGSTAASVTSAGSVTYSGFKNSQTSTVVTGTPTYTTTFTATTAVGTSGVTITPVVSGLTATNYSFVAATGAITVAQAVITVTAAAQSVEYGTTVSTVTGAGSVTYSGFKNSQNSSVITGIPTYTTTYTATTNAATAGVTITPVVSGLTATNYSFTAATGAVTVTKAQLTATADAQSVEYGTAVSSVTGAGSVTYSGFKNSETSSVVTGTPTYTTTYTATTNAATAGVTITPVVSGLTATNYTFAAANGAVTVTKAPLTVTAAAQSVEYGTAASTVTGAGSVTYSGFKNSETSSVVTGTPTYTTTYTATTNAATSGVTITPVVSGLTATNYSFVAATGAITVTQAPLTVTAAAQSVEYGTAASTVTGAGSVTYSGFKNSETSSVVTGTPTYTTTYSATTDAATSGVTITPVVSGLTATNYSFTAASGVITVTKAPLTVTAAAQSVIYATAASTVTGAGSVAYSGFKNSQSSSVVSGSPTYTTTYTATTDASTAGVTITPVVTGLAATNYSFVAATGAITITKATQAAVTLTSTSATFGSALTLTSSGGSGTGAVSYAVTTVGSAGCSVTGTSLSFTSAGTCTVTATKAADTNYDAQSSAATTVTVISAAATTLVITGTTSQTAGTAQNITITAKDAGGNVASGYTGDKSITFSGAATSPDGQVPSIIDSSGTTVLFGTATTLTFTNGVATVAASKNGVMTLYTAETATVSVTDGTLVSAGSGNLSVTVSEGTASKLAMGTQPVAGASGAVLSTQPVVRILDAYGNLTTSTSTVSVSASAGGTLGGSEASSGMAAVAGVATFTDLTLSALTSASITLSFSATNVSGVTSSATSTTGAGTASTIAVNGGNSQSATAGSAVSTAPSVIVTDAAGNPVSGTSVTFAVASGGGALASAAAVTTDASGIATSSTWTLGTTAGANTMTATSGSLSGSPVTFTATGTAGVATKLLMTTQPVAAASGSDLSTQPVVRITDANGNTVTTATDSVAVTASGGTLGGTQTVAAVNGVATFSGLTFAGLTSGSYTLTFAVAGLTSVTSSSITPSGRGPLAQFAVTQTGGTTPLSASTYPAAAYTYLRVTAQDSAGNTVTNFSGSVTLTSGAWSSGIIASSFSSGIKDSVAVYLRTAGTSWQVVATYTAGGIVTSPASSTFTVVAGPAYKLVLDTAAVGGASGAALTTQPVVRVTDMYSNTVTSSSASVSIGSNAPDWQATSGTVMGPQAMAYGQGKWIAVGQYNSKDTSTDGGRTWTAGTLAPSTSSPYWLDIAYGGGLWVAVATSWGIWTSPDGTTWTQRSTSSASTVAYGNGLWLTGDSVNGGMASTDGMTWTSRSGVPDYDLFYAAGRFWGHDISYVSSSWDGSVWTSAGYPNVGLIGDIAYGNGRLVATGSGAIASAADGSTTWSSTSLTGTWPTVAFGGGSFYAGSRSGMATTSPDGVNWSTPTGPLATYQTETLSIEASGYANGVALLGGTGNMTRIFYKDTNVPIVGGTTTVTAVNGIATFTDVTVAGVPATSYPLSITSTGLTAVTTSVIPSATGDVDVNQTLVTAADSSIAAGTGSTTISVQLRDTAGNNVSSSGQTVSVSTTAGSITALTDAGNGRYTATLTASAAQVAAIVRASINGSPLPSAVTIPFTVGAAHALVIVREPVAGASGALLTTQPRIQVVDANGNVIYATAAQIAVSASGGTLGGSQASQAVTIQNGLLSYSNVTFAGITSTSYTLTFSSSGLLSATSAPITPTGAGSASVIAVSAGNSQSATVGTAVATPPSVIVTDSGGNPASGISVTFAVASGGGSATSLSATTDASGIARVGSWTLGSVAGANTLTATSTGMTGSPVTFTATGTAAAATKLQVLLPGESAAPGTVSGKTGSRTAQTAGSATTVTVRAVDANWNVVTTATPTVAITSTDANATLPANAALTAGTGTFSVTFKTAGSATVTATDHAGTLTADTSGSVTVNVGAATKLQVLLPGETAAPGTASGKTGTPTAQTAGSGMTVTVNAVDANWNKVTTQTQTVAITSSDSAATLPSNAALVSGTKNFTVTLKTSGSRTVTASVASGTALTAGVSSGVTVNPATAATISVTTSPTAGASGSVLTQAPVVGLRDAYNNANATYAYDVTAIGGTVSSNLATLSGPKKVLYADGIWMAGTNWTNSSGALYMSRDGVSWTSVLSTAGALSFGYGHGTWTAFIANRRYTSTDGFTWASVVTSSTEFFDVAYGNGVWVGTRTSGATVKSTDGGLTWSAITDLTSKSFNRIEYVNTRFFAYRTIDGHRYTSTDGTSWTPILGGDDYCYGFAYANSRYVQVGHSRTGSYNGSAYYSADGITFTAGTFPTESNSFLSAVSSSGDRFMATGQYAYSSVDGITWVRVGTPSAQPTGLAYGSGMWLGVNSSNVTRLTDSVTGTLTVTPSNGSATFSNLTVNGASGTAIPIYFGGQGLTYTSANVTPTAAGPPARLVLTRASVGTAYGAAFTTQPQVTVQDAAGSTLSSNSSRVVTATVSSGGSLVGTATATAVNGVATFTDLGISGTVGTEYEVVYSSGSLATTSQLITVTQGTQTIAWGADPSTLTYGDAPFTVSATASSGEAVTFASQTSSVCTVSGSTVTIVTAGTCTVRATQAGSSSVASTTSDRSFTINQAAQAALTLTSTSGTYGTALTLATSGGTTAGAMTYTVAAGTASGCTVSSGALTSTSAGTCTVTATMAGSTNYLPVSSSATTVTLAERALTIDADDEAVVFGNSLSQSYSIASGSLAYSDAIATVTYTYTGTGSTAYGPSTTAPTGAGTYTATPSAATFSAGNASSYDITYTAGAVTIGQASQTIAFTQPGDVVYLAAPFAVSPSSSSSLPVTTTSNSTSVCTVASGIVTIVGAGTCSLTASQAGSTDYAAATSVTQTFAVSPANQATLSMSSTDSVLFGNTITLASTGGSGTGATAYGVTAGTCTISGTTLTPGDAGSTCRVRATKVSDANYNSTDSAVQTITIGQAGQVLAFTSTVPTTPIAGDDYTPTGSSTSTVTGSSSGISPVFTIAPSSSSVCSISGGVVHFDTSGSCVIRANAAATTNFTVAGQVTQTIAVGSRNQSIAFTQPSSVTFGTSSVSMSASATSALDVSFALGTGTTNSACTVSTLGVVTVLAVGTCEVTASQAGDSVYAAASDVTRAFSVVAAVPSAPTITSVSSSDQSITVAFTAPGFTGGVAITAYRITATPVGAGTTVTTTACTTSPCTITGLVNGTAYTTMVAGINSAGTGSNSAASGQRTPATAAYAVSNLSAVPGSTTVAVSWTPLTVAQLGGGTFTRYDVSYRPAGSGAWTSFSHASMTTRTTTSVTITGLDNGTSYDFQVVAITSANASEIPGNTAQVVQYPSTTPSAPRNVSVLATTATDVQVSWQVPLSDGGSALISPYYAVTLTSTSVGATTPITCTIPAGARYCSASGLTNGAVYVASVTAINRMGAGAAGTDTYNVPSSDASLSALELTSDAAVVAFSPTFASGTLAYAATVPFDTATVTVTATTTSAAATFTVDGNAETSGVASAPFALQVGENLIEVEVTASDPRYSSTYEITVTRSPAPARNGDAGGPDLQPTTPPSTVSTGGNGAVTVNGETVPFVMTRNATDSGWNISGTGFTMTVSTGTSSGTPQGLSPTGALEWRIGGSLNYAGSGYLPDSRVNVFAISSNTERSASALSARAGVDAVYIGSAWANSNGIVSASFATPAGITAGNYVLQANGLDDDSTVVSANLRMIVLPAKDAITARNVRGAGFFEVGSVKLSGRGLAHLRSLVSQVPAGTKDAQVTVIGSSFGLATTAANLELAKKRAIVLSDYLKGQGVTGHYVVSVSTSFDVKEKATRSAHAAVQPNFNADGQPFSTVDIAYLSTAG